MERVRKQVQQHALDLVGRAAHRGQRFPQSCFKCDPLHASLSIEAALGEGVGRSLRERGHSVHLIDDWAAGGAAQVIQVDDGMLTGGGDPRPGTSSVIGY